jgi:hypothetical protein
MNIIGVTGPARSGKDTVANFIVAMRGGYRYAFADPIRGMLVPLGIDMTDPYWQAHKEEEIPALGVSPRRLMQTIGTEWGRELINPRIWIILANSVLLRHGPGMVISDVRFEDEAQWVRSLGGTIVHVIRPDKQAVEEHKSEQGVTINDQDILIANSGSIVDLHHTVQGFFR